MGLSDTNTNAGVGSASLYVNKSGNNSSATTALWVKSANSGTGTPYAAIFEAGQVGIGTTAPNNLLQVSGNDFLTFTNYTNGPLMLYGLQGTGSNYVDLDFGQTQAHATRPMARVAARQTGAGSELHFGTSNNYALGITNDSLTILPSGFIGINNTAANSGLQVSSSFAVNRTTVADAAYTIIATDHIIAYTSLTTGRTITLPTAADITGREYIIKDESGGAATNNITIATTSSQTIDGASTKVINTNYGVVRVYSNGSNWFTY